MPFRRASGDGEPIPVLAQFGPKSFELCNDFVYEWPRHGRDVLLPKGTQRDTDLASVPGFMTWLVPRYGAHTLAVLLHDDQVDNDMSLEARVDADSMFRDALGETKVPMIRRYLLWSGATVGTLLGARGQLKVRAWLWVGVTVIFTALFWIAVSATVAEWDAVTFGPFGDGWLEAVVVLAAPLMLVEPSGRQRFLLPAFIAGAALLAIFVAVVVVLASALAYLVVEQALAYVLRAYNRVAPGTDVAAHDARIDTAPAARVPAASICEAALR